MNTKTTDLTLTDQTIEEVIDELSSIIEVHRATGNEEQAKKAETTRKQIYRQFY
jgi:3-deoxy-D-arabino-heptulosonate 7-phosphate (DAHP) synthase class II